MFKGEETIHSASRSCTLTATVTLNLNPQGARKHTHMFAWDEIHSKECALEWFAQNHRFLLISCEMKLDLDVNYVISEREVECGDVDRDERVGTADRVMGFSYRLHWAVLASHGLDWAVLDCNDLYWAVLGCNGLHQAVMDCTEPYWAELDFTVLYWASLGGTGLYWAALCCTMLYWAILGFNGLY